MPIMKCGDYTFVRSSRVFSHLYLEGYLSKTAETATTMDNSHIKIHAILSKISDYKMQTIKVGHLLSNK